MTDLFLAILNMSVISSYVIVFVMLTRLFLKKAPKAISYLLWGVVALRLTIPFSIKSILSLIPTVSLSSTTPNYIIQSKNIALNSGIDLVDSFVSKSIVTPVVNININPLQNYLSLGVYIWVLGVVFCLFIVWFL